MKKILSLCVEIEETAARTYRQMARSSQLPDELCLLLQALADEEDDHAMQLRFAMRFPSGAAISVNTIEQTQVQHLLTRAKDLLQLTNRQELDVRQAIDLSIELEEDFCQVHIGNSMTFSDESLKKMFAALAKDDRSHVQKLLDAKGRFL